MLDHLRGRTTDRKLRLFALACLPVVVDRLVASESRAALQVLADFAEGRATTAELRGALDQAVAALDALLDDPSEQRWHHVAVFAADAAVLALNPDTADNIAGVSARCVHALVTAAEAGAEADVRLGECRRQVRLIHDLFGNPFRSVALDPSWRTDTAVSLARSMYESRDFTAMPILADALQDAGCGNEDVLNHCREPGGHIRGCWVVDLLLGKS
jgi:hypothetical protein